MKRISTIIRISIVIVVALTLAMLVYPPHQSRGQTPAPKAQKGNTSPAVRVVKVNAKTIAALPADKKLVADLSRGGVIYEFNPAAGPIDIKRVVVHTAAGDKALGPWLEKTFPDRGLTGLPSKGFRIGAAADLRNLPPTSQNPPPKTSELITKGLARARLRMNAFSCCGSSIAAPQFVPKKKIGACASITITGRSESDSDTGPCHERMGCCESRLEAFSSRCLGRSRTRNSKGE